MSKARNIGMMFFTGLAAAGGFFAGSLYANMDNLKMQKLHVESQCPRNVAVQMQLDGMDSAPQFHFQGPKDFKWSFTLPGKNLSYGLYIDSQLVDHKSQAIEIPAQHTVHIQLDKDCNYKAAIVSGLI
jgi:hypothetical protein